MFCFLYRWRISSSMDSSQPMATQLRRHVERCPGCESFYRRCREIGPRLAAEAGPAATVGDVSPALHAQILRRCRDKTSATRGGRGRAAFPRRLGWLAAAAVLLLAGLLAVRFAVRPARTPPELADDTHPVVWLADPPALASGSVAVIEGAMDEAMATEFASLGEDALAVADMLLAVLPLDLEARIDPETP